MQMIFTIAVSFFLIAEAAAQTVKGDIDICADSRGEYNYGHSNGERGSYELTRGTCGTQNGTLIIRLLENVNCLNGVTLTIGEQQLKLCDYSKGDCFIIQEAAYPCARLTDLKNCAILKWRLNDAPYPVTISQVRASNNGIVHINYDYIKCAEEMTTSEVTTSIRQPREITTIPNALSTETLPHQAEQKGYSIGDILSITFGILLAIILVAFAVLCVRYARLAKQIQSNGEEVAPHQPSEPEPTYSVVNKTTRNLPSEREIVTNEVYGMS